MGQAHCNWLAMATFVVRKMKVRPELFEEAVQETALAGWLASERWSPDGGASWHGWVWIQMERGLVDWMRLRFGRDGNRRTWDEALRSLDAPLGDDQSASLADFLQDSRDPYAEVEARVTLDQMQQRLTGQERRWLAVVRADGQQKVLMDELGISEGRVSQIKHSAVQKMRAAS